MMADLIEREKSISLFLTALTFKERTGKLTWTTAEMKQWIADSMEEFTAVDAVPVVHGRWIHQPEIGWGETWLCSECGEKTVSTVMGIPRYKWCPICGARMDGKDGSDV